MFDLILLRIRWIEFDGRDVFFESAPRHRRHDLFQALQARIDHHTRNITWEDLDLDGSMSLEDWRRNVAQRAVASAQRAAGSH